MGLECGRHVGRHIFTVSPAVPERVLVTRSDALCVCTDLVALLGAAAANDVVAVLVRSVVDAVTVVDAVVALRDVVVAVVVVADVVIESVETRTGCLVVAPRCTVATSSRAVANLVVTTAGM